MLNVVQGVSLMACKNGNILETVIKKLSNTGKKKSIQFRLRR